MAPRGKPARGMVMRGADGDFYVLRANHKAPRKIRKGSALDKALRAHARTHPSAEPANDLPEDILELLEAMFGPLSGAWWWFEGPRLPR